MIGEANDVPPAPDQVSGAPEQEFAAEKQKG
jgi:hypothetical protein